MPPTQDAQRTELHKTIWSIADDLRGSVDGWDFKQYVIGTLFYRFISENLTDYLNEQEGDGFDYATLPDEEAENGRAETVNERGLFILPSELFANVRRDALAGKHDEDLNEVLERIFKNIEASAAGTDSEDDLKGLFADFDVNSAKLGNTVLERNKKLKILLDKIGSMDLGSRYQDNRIDAFGDAYEFLMNMYASNAGKSGGEFFTPAVRLRAADSPGSLWRAGPSVNKVYDPCLRLRVAAAEGCQADAGAANAVRDGFFGQEINLTTYNLCRINMFLHDIELRSISVSSSSDTLTDPQHWDDEPFELIVSNPALLYQMGRARTTRCYINDPRFSPRGRAGTRQQGGPRLYHAHA